MLMITVYFIFFFFNDTATTEIYTLSLHDALPISAPLVGWPRAWSHRSWLTRSASAATRPRARSRAPWWVSSSSTRSEEHTSELQSRQYLVCRLLLEKKKKNP